MGPTIDIFFGFSLYLVLCQNLFSLELCIPIRQKNGEAVTSKYNTKKYSQLSSLVPNMIDDPQNTMNVIGDGISENIKEEYQFLCDNAGSTAADLANKCCQRFPELRGVLSRYTLNC